MTSFIYKNRQILQSLQILTLAKEIETPGTIQELKTPSRTGKSVASDSFKKKREYLDRQIKNFTKNDKSGDLMPHIRYYINTKAKNESLDHLIEKPKTSRLEAAEAAENKRLIVERLKGMAEARRLELEKAKRLEPRKATIFKLEKARKLEATAQKQVTDN